DTLRQRAGGAARVIDVTSVDGSQAVAARTGQHGADRADSGAESFGPYRGGAVLEGDGAAGAAASDGGRESDVLARCGGIEAGSQRGAGRHRVDDLGEGGRGAGVVVGVAPVDSGDAVRTAGQRLGAEGSRTGHQGGGAQNGGAILESDNTAGTA